ncbi:phytanoyl-CoA dioxygenase family protein [Sulfitobacter mediterraneus]|uniref:phytanoyl-CoA dioxygenase family protein n=1 Tax=Sulfitobacter mediterraneus TaxID=83219 RepID=UPI001939BFEA|nr:phytanoyl-CoA dioxygenase family protein [Sulfitobacter mediterraneus]MBM1555897.1 phytanoyl-CoA dioxygenase family protein [Sulfitobacter mediterraneus]MBM1568065.1 phytanoyl-CoA dioxygenase family protein [Sulfitobacter mediterraneus]MBM1571251.1 phytanoyl-CoA dioxygenase family protein [Sulfitobacter mediterraneus]MBM1575039.1 phytanoyl-CoA dioxygenase family protein [Sulfitobacter mediterraneus]MBM1579470.1 phytanoyl-CoA dioxygenase family protein [Sulfitobacter mediterraneus]
MGGGLTEGQRQSYHQNGFVAGVGVFDTSQVADARQQIEALERDHTAGAGGHDLNQFFRVNGHLVIPLLADLARTPAILDAVEGVLGPNLLVWSVELFIKEAGSDKTVSWHQDLTYWGMGETDGEVTAWIALSDVSIEAGCMRFIPGSHHGRIVDHEDTFGADNLLSRGQQIADVNEADAVHGPLRPGEMSLHHGRCFHASGANRSSDRRIGLAIRYVTPEVRDDAPGRDYAMLVRGVDAARGWINVAGPRGLFAAPDLAFYDRVMADQSATLAAGATGDVSMYGATGEEGASQ